MAKTNAVRILETNNITYSIHQYEYSEDELDALTVAQKLNENPEQVFKTLVTEGDKTKYNVFIIPGSYELNLKKAAIASGNKKIEMIKVKDLLSITGYIRGGCSPIGMKKLFPTYIDESALIFDQIYVSAGARGIQIKIAPKDLAATIGANFTDLL